MDGSAETVHSLQLLQDKIKWRILALLDPINLISLSQTNNHFRLLIKPTKVDFARRLLQLECTAEQGGGIPLFRARDGLLLPLPLSPTKAHEQERILQENEENGCRRYTGPPNWEGRAWKAVRWACTDCLRLLPHHHFDNHSLFRLRFRKPGLGSRAEDSWPCWAPPQNNTAWGSARRNKSIRGQKSNKNGFRDIQESECGSKRIFRNCNECLFQRGRLGKQSNGFDGIPKMPIQNSRLIAFGTELNRYFPNLFVNLMDERALRSVSRVHSFDLDHVSVTVHVTHMMRCPGCQHWQEMRAFRLGGSHPHWRPIVHRPGGAGPSGFLQERCRITEDYMEARRCNACFAEQHGRKQLVAVLLDWYLSLNRQLESSLQRHLLRYWELLRFRLETYKPHVQQKLRPLLKKEANVHPSRPEQRLSEKEVVKLERLHGEFRQLLDSGDASPELNKICDDTYGFRQWVTGFLDMTCYWRWVVRTREAVESNPGILGDWALARKSPSLS